MSEETPRKVLRFEDIMAADDIKTEVVEVPEWGGDILVKVFTKAEQLEIRRNARIPGTDDIDTEVFERLAFLAGVADPVISPEQYTLLMEKSSSAIERIMSAIISINAMGEDAVDEKEAGFPS